MFYSLDQKFQFSRLRPIHANFFPNEFLLEKISRADFMVKKSQAKQIQLMLSVPIFEFVFLPVFLNFFHGKKLGNLQRSSILTYCLNFGSVPSSISLHALRQSCRGKQTKTQKSCRKIPPETSTCGTMKTLNRFPFRIRIDVFSGLHSPVFESLFEIHLFPSSRKPIGLFLFSGRKLIIQGSRSENIISKFL